MHQDTVVGPDCFRLANDDQRHVGAHFVRQRYLVKLGVQRSSRDRVALQLVNDDRPRLGFAFDLEVENLVGGRGLEGLVHLLGADLDRHRIESLAIDVGRQHPGSPQRGDLLACDLTRLNWKLPTSHL